MYSEDNENNVKDLFNYLNGNSGISMYNGSIDVIDGKYSQEISILHARSIAEDILFYDNNEEIFNGTLDIIDGKVQNDIIVKGKSLVHSAPLTAIAFDRGFFGNYGNYIVSIGLLLFAFSTAISSSY